jgi:hypothetical protein
MVKRVTAFMTPRPIGDARAFARRARHMPADGERFKHSLDERARTRGD